MIWIVALVVYAIFSADRLKTHSPDNHFSYLADSYLQRNDDGSYPNGTEIYFAVSCLDDTWPTDTDEFIQDSIDAEKASAMVASVRVES